MAVDPVIAELETELSSLSESLTQVRDGECLLCYVHRMLEFGCAGLVWARRYRDLRAPRATALERRLGDKGGFCDCEIFLNGYELAGQHWVMPEPDPNDRFVCEDAQYPDPMPACRGVRKGSIRGCDLWVPARRYRY